MKDEAFIRGNVPMTKAELRAISLAKLQLWQARTFLDVGTGTGSVAVEAAKNFPHLKVLALDNNPEALQLLQANQEKFQLDNITSVLDTAPSAIDVSFDAIFLGGSGGNLKELLQWSFEHLTKKGRIVLNFILLDNANCAIDWLRENKKVFDACQVHVGRYQSLGKGYYYKPMNPAIIIEARNEETQ